MNDIVKAKPVHPAHSPEVRAKAAATIRAKKLAQGGPVTPARRNAKRRQQRADAKRAKAAAIQAARNLHEGLVRGEWKEAPAY